MVGGSLACMDEFPITIKAEYRLPSPSKDVPADAIEQLRARLEALPSPDHHAMPGNDLPGEGRVELPALLGSKRLDLRERRRQRGIVQKLVSDACNDSGLEYWWFDVGWPFEWGD